MTLWLTNTTAKTCLLKSCDWRVLSHLFLKNQDGDRENPQLEVSWRTFTNRIKDIKRLCPFFIMSVVIVKNDHLFTFDLTHNSHWFEYIQQAFIEWHSHSNLVHDYRTLSITHHWMHLGSSAAQGHFDSQCGLNHRPSDQWRTRKPPLATAAQSVLSPLRLFLWPACHSVFVSHSISQHFNSHTNVVALNNLISH